jgi:hypothetical protein
MSPFRKRLCISYTGGGVGIPAGSISWGTVSNGGLVVMRGRSVVPEHSSVFFIMTVTWAADIDTIDNVIDVLLTIGPNVGVTMGFSFSVVVAHPAIIMIDILSRIVTIA